ncbi:DJ-1 family glyoxalase III [Spiroplasma platyhelix]|uniref:DJ-1/PfpI family protein n=1 Tax=Spiroplasma platyhelix PALS-1 TaxID=1276218 RepID=A0A846U210_9MOLU|nr:DJ-1 family glyoxalase III [Spiroplasma platyhelix]MBE4704176.1 Protein/nucleic acid deglycase 3 [Spiroplasma platyhelix PALS-1]NKE38549.1 DJ-1/PfpI family protein [Spiroplasma platyhelix PALS-1]UJB29434.1 protein deglycase [Spiroplasma platyhelix PALS-1]
MSDIKAAIFLATGYEMGEAIITIDLLRRAKITVDLVSVTEELLVKSSHNVEIKCDKIIQTINFSDYKILILPGGSTGVENLNQVQLLKDKLVEFSNDENKLVAAICAAPQILGQLNLLDNKKVTFYPGCDQGLDKAIKTSEPVVVSGNIITGKSIGCAFQFALKIVSILLNKASADEVKQALEF